MTELLERAVEAVRRQPPEVQERVAAAMLMLVEHDPPEPIDTADQNAVSTGLEQLRRRDYASEEEISTAFRSFDR